MRSKLLTENRWLLKLCSEAARFCGLLLLLGTGVLVGVMTGLTVSASESLGPVHESRYEVLIQIPTILFTGFMALILSEFISYLLAEQGEPKWILRHGDKIIYAYVLYVVVMAVIGVVHLRAVDRELGTAISLRDCHIAVAVTLAFVVVRTLIWVSVAIVLRKIVPILREFKTLV